MNSSLEALGGSLSGGGPNGQPPPRAGERVPVSGTTWVYRPHGCASVFLLGVLGFRGLGFRGSGFGVLGVLELLFMGLVMLRSLWGLAL